MKTVLSISLFFLLGPGIAVAATDNRADVPTTTNDVGREHRDLGWIGLLGLAGLAGLTGLRHKSDAHRELEAKGVNVKTVKA